MFFQSRIPFRATGPSALVLAFLLSPTTGFADDRPAAEAPGLVPAISISANSTETPLDEVGSAVTIITAKELEQKQTVLVSDALRSVPGVSVSRAGGVGSLTQVRIRGSESNQTLVIIDGVEMNDPSAGDEFDFSNLLAADIARIEVLRGPQSALYGSQAVGGVINIVTKKGTGDPRVVASLEGGSFGTAQASAAVSAGGDNYNALVSATGLRTNGISTADDRNGNSETDRYQNATVTGKFGYDLTKDFGVDLVGRYNRFKGMGDGWGTRPGDTTTPYGYAYDDNTNWKGSQYFVRPQAHLDLLDGSWQNVLGFSYFNSSRDSLTGDTVDGNSTGRRYKVDYQTSYLFDTPDIANASHTLTFGADFQRDEIDSWSSWADIQKGNNSNSYVGQYQVSLFDSLSITASTRLDQNNMFADAETYRGTVAYMIDATGTKLRTSYGTGVKNPTLTELFGYYGTYQGNPDLKPENAKGWDAGFDQDLFNGVALFSATWFNQRIDDLISTAYVGGMTTSINVQGESRIYGTELALSAQVTQDVTVRGAYTYAHSRDASGEQLIRRPTDTASLDVNYAFLDKKANIDVGMVYTGAQTDWTWSMPYYDRITVDMGGYTVFNVAGSYQLTQAIQLYARVENLFDRRYSEVFSYGAPGAAVYAGIRASF